MSRYRGAVYETSGPTSSGQPSDMPAGEAGGVVRDRDAGGRAKNARPRDGLGRPLPRGMTGIPTTPEDLVLPPAEALREAGRLLGEGGRSTRTRSSRAPGRRPATTSGSCGGGSRSWRSVSPTPAAATRPVRSACSPGPRTGSSRSARTLRTMSPCRVWWPGPVARSPVSKRARRSPRPSSHRRWWFRPGPERAAIGRCATCPRSGRSPVHSRAGGGPWQWSRCRYGRSSASRSR